MTVYRPDGELLTDAPWPVILWGSGGGRGELTFATVDPDRPLDPGEALAADGYVLLNAAELAGLVALLGDQRDGLEDGPGTAVFTPLEENDLPDVGLEDEIYADHHQSFFLLEGPQGRVVLTATMIEPLPADVVELRLWPVDATPGRTSLFVGTTILSQLQDILGDELQYLHA